MFKENIAMLTLEVKIMPTINDLGVIGAVINEELSCESITSRLAIISGTSSCHMAVCCVQPRYWR